MKKIFKFLRKLLWTVLILIMIAIASLEALIYFEVIEMPSKEDVVEWMENLKMKFERRTEDSEQQDFQNLTGEFTDRKIIDEKSALAAIEDMGDVIGIGNVQEELTNCITDVVFDNTYYRFQQEYKGVPIYGRSVIVSADKDGNSLSLTGNYLDHGDAELEVTPKINEEEAVEIAQKQYGGDIRTESTQLTFYSLCDNNIELAWQICVNNNNENEYCFVSAVDGDIIQKINLTDSYSNKEVLDEVHANYQTDREGKSILLLDTDRNIFCHIDTGNVEDFDEISEAPIAECDSEGECSDSVIGFKNLILAYEFFKDQCQLNGFDGKGGEVHLVFLDANTLKDNAVGDVEKDVGYIGIGASVKLFSQSIGNALDLVGHEYTHVIIKSAIGELGNGIIQTEALNEGIADIFGNLIELYTYGEVDNLWDLGEDAGYIKYSMEDLVSMTDTDVSEMNAHELAQIISHAAYLMYKGFNGMDALSVNDLASLYYETIFSLPSDCTFEQFRL